MTNTFSIYEQLIIHSLAEAENFQLPTENQEFKYGYQSTTITDLEEEYDFIIVGAGSAGSVLATRLSEINCWKILVIEAGAGETLFSMIPAYFYYLQFSRINWGYYSTSQKNCCQGMKNKRCIIPQGKVLGGCSSINAEMYVRGNRADFDRWAKQGNKGWSYEEVVPYFKKSENTQTNGDCGYHGVGGLWNNQYPRPPVDTFKNFIEANEILGQKYLDYNGCQQVGVSRTRLNTKKGQRQSTRTAFLETASERKKLHIITEALVTKILIDKDSKSAQGVIFIKGDGKFRAKAKLEVIVSGGAVNSPQLLMLSGIGPAEDLKEKNIEVVANLSQVGKNLVDPHPCFPLTCHTNWSGVDNNLTLRIVQLLKGEGRLFYKCRWYRVPRYERKGLSRFGIHICSSNSSIRSYFRKSIQLGSELIENFINRINYTSDIVYYIVYLHQKSRGKISLKSNNPIDFPDIDVNLFDNIDDIKQLIKGIEFSLKLMGTEPFQKLNATLLDIQICQQFTKYPFAYWNYMIRHVAIPFYHPSGTCRMGPDEKTSVVDQEGKVHGFKNLRVADASIIPVSISGHLTAPTIMLAEKIADLVKLNYNVTSSPKACKCVGRCNLCIIRSWKKLCCS